ncbi:hypothetical protein CDAR_74531 [Caerostris darwini]|uniref:Uncharacterized protein n=1 Tax=Caerostris darwini TaxID=1538125 RepID=A0AAV4P369_9ARAC|nr:hypothetical protein CDAR_74531 [Caerostris darwini]
MQTDCCSSKASSANIHFWGKGRLYGRLCWAASSLNPRWSFLSRNTKPPSSACKYFYSLLACFRVVSSASFALLTFKMRSPSRLKHSFSPKISFSNKLRLIKL